MEPAPAIRLETGGGDALVTCAKTYAVFRRITETEALSRALRNIEQDGRRICRSDKGGGK